MKRTRSYKMASKQQLVNAVTTIRDGLKVELDKAERGKETAFTARSRDIGIADPDIRKEVSKAEFAKGAMGAAYLAADVWLNPERYTARALKSKASRSALAEITRQGEKVLNRQLPQGLNINIDYKGLCLEDVQRGRVPALEAAYQRPVEFGRAKGTAGVQGRYDPETKEGYIGGRVTARFAKGGKVKTYAKGGGVRRPKLK